MSNYYNGTSAYKIDEVKYEVSPGVQENIANRREKRQSKREAFFRRMRVYAFFASVIAVAFGILFTNAVIIEKSSAVNQMQEKLSEITEANNQMMVDIEKNLDLNKIEAIAIGELGMKRPDKYQTVYVDVEQSSYAEVTEAEEDSSVFAATFGAIGTKISHFVEYMN